MNPHRAIFLTGTLVLFLNSGCTQQAGRGSGGAEGPAVHAGRFAMPEENLPHQPVDLQRLIDTTPDSSTVKVPRGRYRLSSPLTISGRHGLHVAFEPGTQVRLADTNADVIVIEDCSDVMISGVRARHEKPLPEYECHGSVVRIRRSANVSLENCELNGCGAVGVGAARSSLSIVNCHIHHNTFNAIYLYACRDVKVIGNIIENNANMLQLEGDNGSICWSDNLIRNNGGYWQEPREPGLLPNVAE